MIKCRALNTADFFSGRIGLTDKQAKRRPPGRLVKAKGTTDVYEIKGPVQFKKGEEFRLDAVPKGSGTWLLDLDAEKAAKEKAAKAKAKADKAAEKAAKGKK